MERRSTIRYSLQLPVRFTWKDEHGTAREGLGRTRDISTKGSFVIADTWPAQGSKVEMKIALPRVPSAFRTLQVHVEGHVGRVMRAQEDWPYSGFAVRNHKFVLREADGGSTDGEVSCDDTFE